MIFHKGERVVNILATSHIPEGAKGTVLEDSDCPWVLWDNGETWCREDVFLELEVTHDRR